MFASSEALLSSAHCRIKPKAFADVMLPTIWLPPKSNFPSWAWCSAWKCLGYVADSLEVGRPCKHGYAGSVPVMTQRVDPIGSARAESRRCRRHKRCQSARRV